MNKPKSRTTYGVYNLIEWHALLRMGKASVKVPFSGGSITTQGITPATYTTSDPVIQFAIESSPEFKSGKIKVVRRNKLEGIIEIGRNAPKPKPVIPSSTGTPVIPSSTETPMYVDNGKKMETANSVDIKPKTDCCATEAGGEDKASSIDTPGALQDTEEEIIEESVNRANATIQVEFSLNDDAKDYLEQNFGVSRNKMRTRADILAFAKANNVDLKFV